MTVNTSIRVAARTLEKMEISHISKRDVGQGWFWCSWLMRLCKESWETILVHKAKAGDMKEQSREGKPKMFVFMT